MKNSLTSIRNKIVKRYTLKEENLYDSKSTNINVLLNRVKLDQEKENRKKILFSVISSLGLILFGILVF
tara:strand:- start:906 stop:1112 length:207 start_codon:yes stop_codon:yes gene_type:complete